LLKKNNRQNMSNVVIKVENVGKQYRLGKVGTGSIAADINRWWHVARGKEDPYLKIGDVNDRTQKSSSNDLVWAIKDINFEVKQGEVLGIIGKNGAGKSTLLKILSRVTAPTIGDIKVRGRIASLLEVGTGFHPELSGRENIFLNGAILGMTRAEIKSKFDEIVEFSGVERYIDTPVKRYSSGMYVRLAFAVAAHLEPEILIVDEVLAVGDAEFQKKCLGKMKDVSGQGRTVLFVSHNMGAVKELCTRALYLKNGILHNTGETNTIIKEYMLNPVTISSANDFLNDTKSRRGNGEVRFSDIKINSGALTLDPQNETRLDLTAQVNKDIKGLYFSFLVRGPENSEPITSTGIILVTREQLKIGKEIKFSVNIAGNTFRTGVFPVYFWLGQKTDMAGDNYPYDVVDSVYYLNYTSDKSTEELGYSSVDPGGYFNIGIKINNIEIK
jgi:lipopolysaccharide transport system ATP-binding protein